MWAGDVTYLPTREGWLYLAVLLDLYSRKVVGWAMSERNDEALTLGGAADGARPAPARAGPASSQRPRHDVRARATYQDVLAQNDIICSMSRKGNCWDNAVVESFFSTLDIECGNQRHVLVDASAARREVAEYILGFYNPTRLHSYLGYMSPMEFERAACITRVHGTRASPIYAYAYAYAYVQRTLDVATARTFVERDAGQHVRAHRQLGGLAQHATARINHLRVREHHELDGARRRLARREISADACAGVVLNSHAMADEVVQLRVVRHRLDISRISSADRSCRSAATRSTRRSA